MRANVAALLALALPEGLPCLDLAGRNATAAASAAAQGWEQLSSALAAGRFPGATGDVLALAVPRATCSCQLDRWDQYAVCKGAYERGAQALSFGIKGYDEWARHVQHEHARLVPKLYDCYDTRKPAGFDNEFFPTCVGGKAGQRGGRAFETLRRLLPAGANQSALVKLDIESSEFEVLESMTPGDFSRIESLNVEYHFYGCPDAARIERLRRVLHQVQEQLVVVDSQLNDYGRPCSGGAAALLPKLVAVSYASPRVCGGPP